MSVTPVSGSLVGLYGKLPAAGDFVTRALPAHFVAAWDDWLQRSLVASRAALGDRWTAIYVESPIWRFVLQPQVCGSQAWAGVLMPSVDRAGRHFPLTLAAAIPPAASALLTVAAAEHWFTQIERIALAALEPDNTLDAVEAQLAQQPLAPVPAGAEARGDWDLAQQMARWWKQGGQPLSLLLASAHRLPAVAEFAAAQLMESEGRGRTLWWTPEPNSGVVAVHGWLGLPPPADFGILLGATAGDSR